MNRVAVQHCFEGLPGERPAFAVETFEHFMLADDRSEYPMTFFVRLCLAGEFDERRFRDAVARAVRRHPMFQVHLRGHPNRPTRELVWMPVREPTSPQITIFQGEEPTRPVHESIDLTREIGLRLSVRLGAAQTVVSAQVHHACADGTGTLRFLEDVLACYDVPDALSPPTLFPGRSGSGGRGTRGDRLRPLESQRLFDRGRFHCDAEDIRRRRLYDFRRAWGFFWAFPKPLATPRHMEGSRIEGLSGPSASPCLPRSSGVGFSGDVQSELTAAELDRLKACAAEREATLNDLMLRDLFLTLDEWNRRHDRRGQPRPIRIAVPVNMRRMGDERMPAANVVSMAFLHRRTRDFADPQMLLRQLVEETRFIKERFMGYPLIRVARLAGRFPYGMKGLLNPGLFWKCYATAVLSNLGQPLQASPLSHSDADEIRAGNLTLKRIDTLPPIRPRTHVAFGTVTYARRMSVAMRYDARVLDHESARRLLGSFIDRLRATAGHEG